MTELEKSFKELLDRHIDFYEPVNQDDLECFFKGTLKPEHMKHTEEVKGLIKALRHYAQKEIYLPTRYGDDDFYEAAANEDEAITALKPFEKEGKE